MISWPKNIFLIIRDQSKFTGYLRRVLEKSLRPPLFFLKKVFASLFFISKKSLRPLIIFEKKSSPPCRWSRPGYPINFDSSLSPLPWLCVNTQMSIFYELLHAFYFISNTFISNARLKFANYQNLSRKILWTELWNLCQMIVLFLNSILNTFFVW